MVFTKIPVCVCVCVCWYGVCVRVCSRQKQVGLTEAQEKAGAGVKRLQQDADRSQEEACRLGEKLAKTEAELRSTLEE